MALPSSYYQTPFLTTETLGFINNPFMTQPSYYIHTFYFTPQYTYFFRTQNFWHFTSLVHTLGGAKR